MLKHLTYKTAKEKQAIVAEMTSKGFVQQSTTGHFIGKHLLFNDGKPEPPEPRNLEAELDQLKARVKAVEDVKPASL